MQTEPARRTAVSTPSIVALNADYITVDFLLNGGDNSTSNGGAEPTPGNDSNIPVPSLSSPQLVGIFGIGKENHQTLKIYYLYCRSK